MIAVSALAVGASPALASADAQFAAGAAPSKAANKTQIVNGQRITPSQAPYQVYLEITDPASGGSSASACGGSIISPTKILTAAHCTFDSANQPNNTASNYFVVAGISDLTQAPGGDPANDAVQTREASAVDRHPGYVSPPGGGGTLEQLADDAAIITLAQPLDLSTAQVKAIGVTGQGANLPTGTPAFASGFGAQANGGQPNGLLYGLNTQLADATAQTNAGPLNALYVMTQSAVGSTCQGDSGGGLVAGGAVIGIVSSGARCGDNEVGNFTSVAAGEIQTFIRNAVTGGAEPIPQAPRGGADIKISGPTPFRSGSTVTCSAGTWTNAPTFGYVFSDAASGAVLQEGPSAKYVAKDADVGKRIVCRASATNAGGVGYTPLTEPTPTVAAAPKPDPARLSAAVTSGSSRVKQGGRVSFRVTVRNTGDTAARKVRTCVRVGSRFSIVSRGGAKLTGGRLCWTNSTLRTRTTKRFSLRADRDARSGRTTAATVSVTGTGVRSASARRAVTIQRRAAAPTPGGVTG